MSAVPVPTTGKLPALTSGIPVPHSSKDWTHLVAAGAVIAGHKRAGLAVAAAGTAIALTQEQEVVKSWWKNLPGFLSDAQNFLERAEAYIEQAAVQGHRIQSILRR